MRRGLRRALAALATLALGAGLAVVGAAAPASAHHNEISGKVVCEKDGSATLTWTVQNSEWDKSETIVESSALEVVAVGTKIGAGKSAEFEQSDVVNGESYTLTLTAEWSNGQTKTNTKTVTVSVPKKCAGEPKKLTICHATESDVKNPYVRITIARSAVVNAHYKKHQWGEDIVPAFTYKGKAYAATGDQSLLAYPDCTKPEPKKVPVPAEPKIVDLCGTGDDKVETPAKVEGVSWTISPIVNGKATATAKTEKGYVFANGKTEITFELAFPNSAPCVQTLPEPPAPTATEQCGTDGDQVVVKTVAGVRWEIGEIVYTGTKGEAVVVAHANEGFVFPGGKTSITFTVTFDGTPCPPETIALVKPEVVDVCGTDGDALTLPEQKHVTWSQEGTPASGAVVATATADKGYVFPAEGDFAGGPVRTFTITYDQKPCPKAIEIPAQPEKIEFCGTDRDAIAEPATVEGVRWEIGEVEGGAATAVAYAEDGYVFTGGVTKAVFEFSFETTECETPTLFGSTVAAVCEANTPWIVFDIVLNDPDGISKGHTAYLVLSDGTHTEKVELGALGEDGTLEDRVLWPGAAVDEAGTPIAWPGWKQLPNGRWVVTEENFGWTHSLTSATLEVNPELSIDLEYPPAVAGCGPASSPASDGDPKPIGSGEGLASTGFAGGPLLYVAGGLVLLGAVVLAVTIIVRRKRA